MDLVEFQGKQLFGRNGVPVPPPGTACRSVSEVKDAARSHLDAGASAVMVKAQVKTGGRGKAGGVKYCPTLEDAVEAAESIIGLDIKGHEVRVVWVEPASDIAEEYYLSVMHDRVSKGELIICSVEGGVEIEEVNRTNPDAVVKRTVVPSEREHGLPREIADDIVTEARFPEEVRDQAADLLVKLFAAYLAEDATLAEINPLIRTGPASGTDRAGADRIIALDAKVTLDDNAAFRHDGFSEWKIDGLDADDPLEAEAKAKGIQYVKLDGHVGVARQRCRPRDGHPRRGGAERWAGGQLPRRRRWRVRGRDGGVARARPLRPGRQERVHQHLRRHHPRRGGGGRHRRGDQAAR